MVRVQPEAFDLFLAVRLDRPPVAGLLVSVQGLLAAVVEGVDRLALALSEVGDVLRGPERLEGRVEARVGMRDGG